MFVDKAEIFVKAGKGGDGRVSFRKEKYVPAGGPDGGDGGRGGSVIAIVDEGMRTLMDFRYLKKYIAENGENGMKKKMFGKDAKDLVFKVPPGTVIRDAETGKVLADLLKAGDSAVIARAGKGGRGNVHFKTATRQAPTFAEQGTYGEERNIILELKMLADVGLVGYPNVGKSTFLSATTMAKPKIANYHFTTLTPNLGVVEVIKGKSFVLADIPGLIEGASEGVGLGHEFLRHVERTRLIIHVVDVSGTEGRDPSEDFVKINQELERYSQALTERPQVIAANKIDLLYDREGLDAFVEEMTAKGYKVFPISAATGEGIDALMYYVTECLDTIEPPVIHEVVEAFEDSADLDQTIRYKKIHNLYVVEGLPMERLVYSTDFTDVESLRRFQEILRKSGVIDELRKMGVQDGDSVRVESVEFEFYD
ncbi:GTPase ObgE [Acidaminobacter hydrogenoformans]|uniref:GTPase Obg n=1 Tax=Acidaminobacter hydrogenoformans DSM 2784 TaxID=1120920 RepID=A0A1G5RTM2_9FIRM|nr:GTPase ObgE [Acidaminobacter hydrogenoformans]SCZ77198.1 GTP-binding protein [Acidaminobacter hydrogenoformans DSM 2784]